MYACRSIALSILNQVTSWIVGKPETDFTFRSPVVAKGLGTQIKALGRPGLRYAVPEPADLVLNRESGVISTGEEFPS
jgi:hypothetical protein